MGTRPGVAVTYCWSAAFSAVKRAWQSSAASSRGVGWGLRHVCPQLCAPLPPSLPAIRPEGKNNRLFVFSISMASVAHWSLDVAADSQEELQDWVKKIREVAQTADARVRACQWPSEQRGSPGWAAPAARQGSEETHVVGGMAC